jgi:hypothetical protein
LFLKSNLFLLQMSYKCFNIFCSDWQIQFSKRRIRFENNWNYYTVRTTNEDGKFNRFTQSTRLKLIFLDLIINNYMKIEAVKTFRLYRINFSLMVCFELKINWPKLKYVFSRKESNTLFNDNLVTILIYLLILTLKGMTSF